MYQSLVILFLLCFSSSLILPFKYPLIFYFNTCTLNLLLFCTMTNKYTIISQIMTLIICEIILYWLVIVPNNPHSLFPKCLLVSHPALFRVFSESCLKIMFPPEPWYRSGTIVLCSQYISVFFVFGCASSARSIRLLSTLWWWQYWAQQTKYESSDYVANSDWHLNMKSHFILTFLS
jgi:hypothetical protein